MINVANVDKMRPTLNDGEEWLRMIDNKLMAMLRMVNHGSCLQWFLMVKKHFMMFDKG